MKRFYKSVELVSADNGYEARLDRRVIKTPAKNPLILPAKPFAQAIAEEWRAQSEDIDPQTMPLTRLANSVIDGVLQRIDEVRTDVAAYGQTDLLCYWADTPLDLVERQARHWQPILDWCRERLGEDIQTASGVVAVQQCDGLNEALMREMEGFTPFELAAVHELTTLTGSVLIALAVAHQGIAPDVAWQAAHVDEHYQRDAWGDDAEALERRSHRRTAFENAVRALQLLRPAG